MRLCIRRAAATALVFGLWGYTASASAAPPLTIDNCVVKVDGKIHFAYMRVRLAA